MTEKNFYGIFRHWLRAHWHGSGIFEVKLTSKSSLPYSALAKHQKASLLASNKQGGALIFKPPDVGFYNPADYIVLSEVPAFVVVRFYKRGSKVFWLVPIGAWIKEEEGSKRKSLTPERARAIGIRCEL